MDLGTNRTVKKVAIGIAHVCAILDNVKVKCWGQNNFGQLGQEHTNDIGDNANEMGDNLPAVQY